MTKLGDFTRPMMSGSAGFHADQARRNFAKEVDDLLAPQLTADDHLARIVHAVDLEHVLGEINADGVNLHVDDLPPVIRCSTISLLAHSMPGAGVVHHITSVVPSDKRGPVNFRNAPDSDRDRVAGQRSPWANSRHR